MMESKVFVGLVHSLLGILGKFIVNFRGFFSFNLQNMLMSEPALLYQWWLI